MRKDIMNRITCHTRSDSESRGLVPKEPSVSVTHYLRHPEGTRDGILVEQRARMENRVSLRDHLLERMAMRDRPARWEV
jgi:hypothetical protein